jgi:hypothetical protein
MKLMFHQGRLDRVRQPLTSTIARQKCLPAETAKGQEMSVIGFIKSAAAFALGDVRRIHDDYCRKVASPVEVGKQKKRDFFTASITVMR